MRTIENCRRPGLFILAIFLFVQLAACSSTKPYELNLMPAPELYAGLSTLPFSRSNFNLAVPYGGMLYATDRQPATGSDLKHEFYENHRGHLLRVGVGTIGFAEGQYTWAEFKNISTRKIRGQNYPLRISGINEFGVLDSSRSKLFRNPGAVETASANMAFASAINKKLSASKVKDIYIYVHGYKIVFSNPLLVATELWHFLDYQGVFIAYSWPSTPRRLAYARDLETAAYSSRNLRLLIEYLASSTKVHRINIIAHSAGTRVATGALEQLTLINSTNTGKQAANKYRIGKVILIGSDMDRDIFSSYLEDGLLDIPESLMIYLSGTDRALRLSKFIFTRQRVGQAFTLNDFPGESIEYIQRNPRLIIIDVTGAKNADDEKGHDYFRRSPWVSSDVLMALRFNLAPGDRGLVRDARLPVWKFPGNYIDRIKNLLGNKINTR